MTVATFKNFLQNITRPRHAVLGSNNFTESPRAGRSVARKKPLQRPPDMPRVALARQNDLGHAQRLDPPRVVRLIEGEGTPHRRHPGTQGMRTRSDTALMRDR